jgi:hypothetical protein
MNLEPDVVLVAVLVSTVVVAAARWIVWAGRGTGDEQGPDFQERGWDGKVIEPAGLTRRVNAVRLDYLPFLFGKPAPDPHGELMLEIQRRVRAHAFFQR